MIRELVEYLTAHPRADDRDQAYAALFNKAIEHDWFAEVEELGRQYLKTDPEGPVKALAQIIQTMARAQAGRYDEALARFRELIKGLDPNEQEEFAASFSDSFGGQAIAAGEYNIALRPGVRGAPRSVRREPDPAPEGPGRPEEVGPGRPDRPIVRGGGYPGPVDPQRRLSGQVRAPGFLGDLVRADAIAEHCPRLQAAYRTYHEAGLEIVGVSLDESKDAVVEFVKARKVPWPQVHNAGAASDLVQAFGVSSIPATYLIDPQGTIIRLDLRGKALDEALARLIKRPTATTGAR